MRTCRSSYLGTVFRLDLAALLLVLIVLPVIAQDDSDAKKLEERLKEPSWPFSSNSRSSAIMTSTGRPSAGHRFITVPSGYSTADEIPLR